jgi:hypothetical protein
MLASKACWVLNSLLFQKTGCRGKVSAEAARLWPRLQAIATSLALSRVWLLQLVIHIEGWIAWRACLFGVERSSILFQAGTLTGVALEFGLMLRLSNRPRVSLRL